MVDQPVPRVFISYRRDDTQHVAGRICDHLVANLGQSNVFIDVASIQPGVDFSAAIQQAIQQCDTLLVLIGRRWLVVTEHLRRRRRLEDPDDPVAMEIEHALSCQINVIPVLIDGVAMPQRHELPKRLILLSDMNAIRVDYETFHVDVDRLIKCLQSSNLPQSGVSFRPIVKRINFKLQHSAVDERLSRKPEQAPEYCLVQQALRDMMDRWNTSYRTAMRAARKKEKSYKGDGLRLRLPHFLSSFSSIKRQASRLAYHYEDRRWLLVGANVEKLRSEALKIQPLSPTESNPKGRAAICPTAYSAQQYSNLAAEVCSEIDQLLADGST